MFLFSNKYFHFMKSVLALTNSVDPNEIAYYAAFHLDLNYLPKYPFRGFSYIMVTHIFCIGPNHFSLPFK